MVSVVRGLCDGPYGRHIGHTHSLNLAGLLHGTLTLWDYSLFNGPSWTPFWGSDFVFSSMDYLPLWIIDSLCILTCVQSSALFSIYHCVLVDLDLCSFSWPSFMAFNILVASIVS